jgi:phosphatidylserine/phosphatidylglycerophosphate/cardiolipin synthase-like enzyme
MIDSRTRYASLVLLLAVTPAGAVELHYAPIENLERIDVLQLNSARKTIDMAAYVLTDAPLIGALAAAAYRGVKIRLYLDGGQAGGEAMAPVGPFGTLLTAPHVIVKQKRSGKPIMHLQSYCVDGRLFRTGSASFSAAGLKQQDNDLLLFDDSRMCSDFTINFDVLWDGKDAE